VSYPDQVKNTLGSKACRPDGKFLFLLGLVLVLIFPFFFWSGPGYHSPRSYKAVWNLGHILFFTLATVFACSLAWQRGMKTDQKFVLVLLVTGIVIGILIEVVQLGISGRSVDCRDVYRDILGLFAGLFLCRIIPGPIRLQRLLGLILIIFLLFSGVPLIMALTDEVLAVRQFPLLADFETPFEAWRFMPTNRVRRTALYARHGRHSLRVQLTTATYSGVSLFSFPHNWQGYEQLHFSVYNPYQSELTLYCRIHDKWHKDHGQRYDDRFNQRLRLIPGWNDYRIPLAAVRFAPLQREMDMRAIESFALFVARQDRARVLYVDHIFLSR